VSQPALLPVVGAFGLAVVLALLSALSTAALALGLQVSQALSERERALSTRLTVALVGDTDPARIEEARRTLTGLAAVLSARRIESTHTLSNLGTPEPVVFDLALADAESISADRIEAHLGEAGFQGVATDHERFAGETLRVLERLRGYALGFAGAVMAASVVVAFLAASASLSAQSSMARLLDQMGATRIFIARQIVRSLLAIGLPAIAVGSALGAVVSAFVPGILPVMTDLSVLHLAAAGLSTLGLCVLAATLGGASGVFRAFGRTQ
jgi:hypothetical protein